ncbi:hypothetical protein MP228_011919 [Amoeboaphelidium protococcarum]|nr:hypothetical protein MP228_011919 [Amoeboaphelidium protococcarum]
MKKYTSLVKCYVSRRCAVSSRRYGSSSQAQQGVKYATSQAEDIKVVDNQPNQLPQCEVINQGHGSLIKVNLSTGQGVITRPRVVLGSSAELRMNTVVDDKSIMRKLAGLPFALSKIENISKQGEKLNFPVQLLLRPSSIGDCQVLDLGVDSESQFSSNYNSPVIVKSEAFLGVTDGVEMSYRLGSPLGLSVEAKIGHLQVSGGGKVFIQSPYGSIVRIQLGENEEYCVNPRHMLAWSLTNKPVALFDQNIYQDEVLPGASLSQYLQYWALNKARSLMYGSYYQVKGRVLGDKDALYRITGPGFVYLNTRLPVPSRFSSLREIISNLRLRSSQ